LGIAFDHLSLAVHFVTATINPNLPIYNNVTSLFEYLPFKMVHTRKVTKGAEEEGIKAQNAGPPKATATPSNPAQAVRETTAVVKLWRNFPDISEDDAKTFLSKANFDVQKAAAAIQARLPIILGDEASSGCSQPPRPASAPVKRGANIMGGEVRATSDNPPKTGMAQVSRPRIAVKKKAPDLS
jgi:hypothetical protein